MNATTATTAPTPPTAPTAPTAPTERNDPITSARRRPEVTDLARIVAVVTPDEHGAAAIAWSASLRRASGARLGVVRSVVNPSAEHSPEVEADFLDRSTDELDGWLTSQRVAADAIESVDAAELIDAVRRIVRPGDLVVVADAHHAGHAIEPGRLVSELIERVPVVVVPERYQVELDTPILVGIDGDDINYGTVEWARRLAERAGRPLHAVVATDPMYDTFDSAGNHGDDERRARIEAHAECIELHERSGTVADVLTRVADETDAFLTVIGHHHHRYTEHIGFAHPVRHLAQDPPMPMVMVPEAIAAKLERAEVDEHHDGLGRLRLTDDELAQLQGARTVVALTDHGDEPVLAIERRAAARIAAELDARLVLLDRTAQTWMDAPHLDGPQTIDDVRSHGDVELARQMTETLAFGAAEVVAYASSVPDFDAVIDTVRATDADVVVVPDRLDHPRLVERWSHHGDVAMTIRERLDIPHVVAVHDAETMRLI